MGKKITRERDLCGSCEHLKNKLEEGKKKYGERETHTACVRGVREKEKREKDEERCIVSTIGHAPKRKKTENKKWRERERCICLMCTSESDRGVCGGGGRRARRVCNSCTSKTCILKKRKGRKE